MFLKSLAAIGLAAEGVGSSNELLKRLGAEAIEVVETEAGNFRVLRLPGGAEVWLHIGQPGSPHANRIVGITPFHSGEGKVRVRIIDVIRFDAADRLTGAYLCYLPAPRRGDRELCVALEMIPFMRELGASASGFRYVQLLALASEVTVYPGLTQYLAAVPKERLISPGAIAPMTVACGAERHLAATGQMRCIALVTGVVQQARRIVNPLSEQAYWWVLLDTDRGPLNLVANATAIAGTTPAVGAVLQAKARLVARDMGWPESGAGGIDSEAAE